MSQPDLLFAHRLAMELGHADVEAMLATLTTSQIVRWRAYFEIEPFGFPARERRFTTLATICGQGRVPDSAIRYQRPAGSASRYMTRRQIIDLARRQYGQ